MERYSVGSVGFLRDGVVAPHHQLHPLGTKLAGALFHLGKQRTHTQKTGRLIRATGIFIVRLVFLLLSLGEDDFIHEEENDHRDAAVQNGSADVVDEVRHQQAGHCHPHTVDNPHNDLFSMRKNIRACISGSKPNQNRSLS